MYKDGKIWIAQTEDKKDIFLYPKMANRHGLIAGATGTGKTVTLKVLAESFSDAGVPVFLADVKGDLSGMCECGTDSDDMKERINRFGLNAAGFDFCKYPVNFWDIYGKAGMPLHTTVSEMGPMLLARILQLTDIQEDILSVVFRIADDQKLLLLDSKDLRLMLQYCGDNSKEFTTKYGNIPKQSIGAITRALVALEGQGGDTFFGEPALNIADWFSKDADGKGMINILDSRELITNPLLYSTFLLWMLSELFETLPEVGDLDAPKMVFFFDEAHLLFNDTPKALVQKIEQVVKLIRSKGVGVYFITQSPSDIPNEVLAQLGNKIQHALRAFTPADQKMLNAAASSFRENPAFKTLDALTQMGTGEALISVLDEEGLPTVVERAFILPPQSHMGTIDDALRDQLIKANVLYTKYSQFVDRDSAYEFLTRKSDADAAAKKAEADNAASQKQAAKETTQRERAVKNTMSNVVGSAGSAIGRELGRTLGGSSSFGKRLGGNVGASLGRGLLKTLFKI